MVDLEREVSLFRMGFRPFFLLAGSYALLALPTWSGMIARAIPLPPSFPSWIWHAHEMLFGYAMAVIAGFLLTAVRNWTGIQTLHGLPLAGLAFAWCAARVLLLCPVTAWYGAMLDVAFIAWLCASVSRPLLRTRQWRNLALVSKVYFLLAADLLFYVGLFNGWNKGIELGVQFGLYTVLALILVVARRVMPMFIQRGLSLASPPRNLRLIDVAALPLFLTVMVLDLAHVWSFVSASLACLLAILHLARLALWYVPRIWRHPLLWVLFLGYAWIIAGFFLLAGALLGWVGYSLAVHAFAVGGIGMMTIGMMARVAWGHTGREISQPHKGLPWIFLPIMLAASLRVVAPLAIPEAGAVWIHTSSLLWAVSFAAFVWIYTPVLIQPRVDGRWG